MYSKAIKAWDENQENLKTAISKCTLSQLGSYTDLVALLIQEVLYKSDLQISKEYLEINDGDYQGTLIYILHRDVYQPSADEYYSMWVSYGSCSVCDTLESIIFASGSDNSKPSEQQVKELWTLCLHFIQSFKPLYSTEQLWDID